MRYIFSIKKYKVWGMRFILTMTVIMLLGLSSVSFSNDTGQNVYENSIYILSQNLELTPSDASITMLSYECEYSHSAKCNSSNFMLSYNLHQYILHIGAHKQVIFISNNALNGYAPDIMLPPPKIS